MKIVAIKDMSAGNNSVGEMWKETKIFKGTDTLQEVIGWAGRNKNVVLSLPDEENLYKLNEDDDLPF